MPQMHITFTGEWGEANGFLKNAPKIFERHIKRATKEACVYLVKLIKARIREKKYTKNSLLTLALNKGNTPLYKQRNLYKAIDYTLKNSFQAEIGIIHNSITTGGVTGERSTMYQVAYAVHEGYEIKVTPKMRQAIAIALRKSSSSKAKRFSKKHGQGGAKAVWRVPPRRFLSSVFNNQQVQKHIMKLWEDAIFNGVVEASSSKWKTNTP